MKQFIFAVLLISFVCNANLNSQTSNQKVTNAIKNKKVNNKPQKIVEEKLVNEVAEIVFSNPNQKIAYYNHLGKIAYRISRNFIKDYFLLSINTDRKVYEIKDISIQKISDAGDYGLIIAGLNETSNNGFAICLPLEINDSSFYLDAHADITIKCGIGKRCHKIKFSNNYCNCNDNDWLGEGNIGNTEYFSFHTSNYKIKIEELNFSLDYSNFCNLINANVLQTQIK